VLGQAERPRPSWRLSSALKLGWQGWGKGPFLSYRENWKPPATSGQFSRSNADAAFGFEKGAINLVTAAANFSSAQQMVSGEQDVR
jgi:hypothetical protein